MEKYLLWILLLVLCGCNVQTSKINIEPAQQDSVSPTDSSESVIEFMCRDASDDVLTPEEIEWWDERNAEGGTLIVRGAERELDTIVNHLHMKFITDP